MADEPNKSAVSSPANSEALFRHLVENAREFAIFSTDLARRVITWDVGAERLTGFAEPDVLGKSADIIFTAEDRATGAPEREASQALRAGKAEDERWHVRRDGSRFWGSGLMMPMSAEPGGVQGLLKILRDRTEQRLAEARLAAVARDLEASEERARLLVAEVRDYGIYMIDPQGMVLTWNAGAERLTGYSEAEILGRSFTRFFTERDVRNGIPADEIRKAAEEGRDENEGFRVRKDGSLFWGNEVISAVRTADGRLAGFTKIVRDLTERKHAETELRRARDELEIRVQERTADLSRALLTLEHEVHERNRAEQARRELLRRLVTVQEEERLRIARELHDEMGQRLTALLLELRLFRDSLPEDHLGQQRLERLHEHVAQIGLEVHRIALELRPTALDDHGLPAFLVNYLEDWGQRGGVEVDFHHPGLDWRPAPLVETALFRIVQEALTNVLKHAGATRVGVVLEWHGHDLHLIVEDNGRGFDTETPPNVAPGSSACLGLLGIKERVAMVGGTFTIESRAGGPTTLFVRIPSPPRGEDSAP